MDRFMLVSLLLLFVCGNGVGGSHVPNKEDDNYEAAQVGRLHRTKFHFQPHKHWINDPNGPMYYKGYYHLFYQYNPKGAVWGNIVWAHSVSTDLLNWRHLPAALSPSHSFDTYGCWSGSATILYKGQPVILYTGVDENHHQVQNVAFPKNLSDPLLVHWHKPRYNPVIAPASTVNATSFRDPTTAWRGKDGIWRVTVGSVWGKRGLSLLYKSKDFKTWRMTENPLHFVEGTGMWECPDFFPVANSSRNGVDNSLPRPWYKHVMKVSLDDTRYEYYTIGKYDIQEERYVPDGMSPDNCTGLRYDYGNFYASKTFYDPSRKRRVLWSWANESDSRDDDIRKGWAGIQTIPRTIWLHKNGKQLVQWPIKELETLRGKEVTLRGVKLMGGSVIKVEGIQTNEVDVEASFHIRRLAEAERWDPNWTTSDPQRLCGMRGAGIRGGVGPFGLLVLSSEDLSEMTAVFFRVFTDGLGKYKVLMCHDPSRSTTSKDIYKPTFGGFVHIDIAKHRKISLRSLVDNSVVESFGELGKTCITSRVYPLIAVQKGARLFAFNNGTSDIVVAELRAWEMASANIS